MCPNRATDCNRDRVGVLAGIDNEQTPSVYEGCPSETYPETGDLGEYRRGLRRLGVAGDGLEDHRPCAGGDGRVLNHFSAVSIRCG